MHSKANITYLLNPTIQTKTSIKSYHTLTQTGPSAATLSLFRSLSPISPQTATSSLRLAHIEPNGKTRDHLRYLDSRKARLPLMTLAALSSVANSSSRKTSTSSSSDSAKVQTTEHPSFIAVSSEQDGKTYIRKSHAPPCQIEGCKNLAVSRGCCVRHGGGSRCTEPGCTKRAKLYQRCFQHGGFKTCTEPLCTKKAKRYGHCWSHGGGHIYEFPDCTKVSTQCGLCWAHGGGNRCKHEGCNRRSYQKYDYHCVRHARKTVETSMVVSTSP